METSYFVISFCSKSQSIKSVSKLTKISISDTDWSQREIRVCWKHVFYIFELTSFEVDNESLYEAKSIMELIYYAIISFWIKVRSAPTTPP